jgi:hypothetical protein
MNYSTHYNLLITRAQNRELLTHKETHHIIPKCLGGLDTKDNLVNLTYREHYIAHLLLAKIHGGPLWHAVNLMGRLKKYSNRHYERARIEHSKMVSETNRRTKTKPKEDRHYKCSNCGTGLVYNEFCHHTPKEHYYCNAKCRNHFVFRLKDKSDTIQYQIHNCEWCNDKLQLNPASKSKFKCCSQSCRMKLVLKDGGHTAWNKGLPNPQSAINGKKSAAKLSATVKGRTRLYREDGSWTWQYPNK